MYINYQLNKLCAIAHIDTVMFNYSLKQAFVINIRPILLTK